MNHRNQILFLVFAIFVSSYFSFSSSTSDDNQFSSAADGKVLELVDSNFDSAIASFDFLLVDFYAPWCGHCKRLSPELDAAAPVLAKLEKPIAIAKVNADKYTRLATKYEIDGFPTMMIFMHGVPVEYNGPRKAELLVRFLKKFVAPDVTLLESDSAISNFIEMAGTNFPIFVGFGLNESVVSELAIKYKRRAWFSVAKDFSEEAMITYDFDKVPAMVSMHQHYNERSVFYGPFEGDFLEDYVKQSLLPLTMPINYETLKMLKDDERKVVLTILEDESNERSVQLIKLLRAAASANRDLIFGYVGYKQWEDFADTFGVNKKTKLPKMIVWDRDEEYFTVVDSENLEEEDQGTQITRFLEGYREGRTEKKSISGPSIMGFLNSLISIKSVYLLVFIVAVIMLIQTINKQDDQDEVPQRTQAHPTGDQGSSSASESENKPVYRPADKED
ncbi:hypothetical protein MKW98_016938 [Papaver atlanticum]|uniref:Thioredoxin domain-containing protein n=1 Tax=Papaver atlanticum TaxID=357466 RepID=A0AAD4THG0_9MAGN|nr:hypothetical protein MKW98_016938 [Papaver atlanticum]